MPYTRAEVANRAGVDPAFVDRMCSLQILKAENDAFSEGDMRRARILHSMVTSGIPLEAIGEGIRTGVVDLAFVDDPAYELFAGLTDETFQQASDRTGVPFSVLAAMREATGSPPPKPEDREIIALYHGQQSNAWMRNFFGGFEAGLAAAGLYNPVERPPAICFLDLSGYTRLTDERGDAAAADLAGRLSRLVNGTSVRHGGKAIKWLGDGVMFHFRDPGPGVLAALEMVEGAQEAQLPPAHVGLHAGPVLFQEGDYFGRTVNVASRIADYARRGEVLVTDEVIAATTIEGVQFESIGPVELKGLTEVIPLSVARRA